MAELGVLERLWWGSGPAARLARAALFPLEAAYAGAVAVRGALYDLGIFRPLDPALVTVSIGNLSVGGTGKTPVAAWMAAALLGGGARPAIVLRGYGSDEPLVHATLNPGVPVIVDSDRVQGVARAAVMGADVAVLDDAFQHRRARRAADLVLVSADRWTRSHRLLPAGPWREPLRALRRASLAVVTRRSADPEVASALSASLARVAPNVPIAILHLGLGRLHGARNATETLSLSSLRGMRVHAIAAIGDPQSFVRQLEGEGATVRASLFRDHHRFTAADASRLAAGSTPNELVVCTLKDVVKLATHWPREAPSLWYVSQHVLVERGGESIDAVLEGVLRSRTSTLSPPAAAG